LIVATEIPLPIKNKVTVSPIFAAFTTTPYPAIGQYVSHTAARQNSPTNHGH
jgi:hypothetical protein